MNRYIKSWSDLLFWLGVVVVGLILFLGIGGTIVTLTVFAGLGAWLAFLAALVAWGFIANASVQIIIHDDTGDLGPLNMLWFIVQAIALGTISLVDGVRFALEPWPRDWFRIVGVVLAFACAGFVAYVIAGIAGFLAGSEIHKKLQRREHPEYEQLRRTVIKKNSEPDRD